MQPDKIIKPVAYCLRLLTKTKKTYDPTQQEYLAVVWTVLTFRLYLKGTHFTIRTGHDLLKWFLNLADATGRLTGWRLRLSEFSFDVVHRADLNQKKTTRFFV